MAQDLLAMRQALAGALLPQGSAGHPAGAAQAPGEAQQGDEEGEARRMEEWLGPEVCLALLLLAQEHAASVATAASSSSGTHAPGAVPQQPP